jgi:hypothetical protein
LSALEFSKSEQSGGGIMSDYISETMAQALVARRRRNIGPWKSIKKVQSANRGVPSAEVENAIAKAVMAVRKSRREPSPVDRPN